MPINKQIQVRRDTASNWTSVNPVLALGEAGLEIDTNSLKYGDGSTEWNNLPYFSETTLSIQTKRPIKTVNGESLEGNGNVQIDYNDLDNLPTLISNHSELNLDDGTNPHGTTKNDVGLNNVDNTSDIDKPISNATQTALNLKENLSNKVTNLESPNNTNYPTTLVVSTTLNTKLDKSSTPSSVYTTDASGGQTMISLSAFESVDNKVTDLNTPNNTTYPTTLAVVNENKKANITVELIDLLTTNFYAPNALRINSTALISGSGTITLKVNDVAYTLGNLIAQGAKITVETTTASVYNLISVYE